MSNEPRKPPEIGSSLRDTIQAAIIGAVCISVLALFFGTMMFNTHNYTKRVEACTRLNMQWVGGNCVDKVDVPAAQDVEEKEGEDEPETTE